MCFHFIYFLFRLCLYACKYICGDREFPEATGNNKKEAKEAAAKLVHEILTKQVNEKERNEMFWPLKIFGLFWQIEWISY